jgi:Domain of unknown function (DUF5666)
MKFQLNLTGPIKLALAGLLMVGVGCAQIESAIAPTNMCNDQAALVNPAANAAQSSTVAGARPGIGGTGMSVSQGGIGGTGIDKGGVGGTGIVGVITGFASICVNGVEVHYAPNMPVSSNGALGNVSQLTVGQVVLIKAQGRGMQLTAQSISTMYAAVGPVEGISATEGSLQVIGQKLVDADASRIRALQKGQWVQASGHRLANGEVVVTSLEPIEPLALAQINGRITLIEANQITIEGTRVALGAVALPTGAAMGMELSVSGVWDGQQLQAQLLVLEPTRKAIGLTERVVLQGYVQELRGNQLVLGHSVVNLNANAQITGGGSNGLAVNQRVQISGTRDRNQQVTAERVNVQAEASESGSGKSRSGKTEDGSSKSGSSNSGSGSSNSGSGSSNSGSGSSGSGGKGGTSGGGSGGCTSGGGSGGGGSGRN